jgi:hypothetical protein
MKDHNRIISMLFNQLLLAWDTIEESRGNQLGCTFEECLDDCLFILNEEQKEILREVVSSNNE